MSPAESSAGETVSQPKILADRSVQRESAKLEEHQDLSRPVDEQDKSTGLEGKSGPDHAKDKQIAETFPNKPMQELNSLFRALEVAAEAITEKLREAPQVATGWRKISKGFVKFAKDVGPFVTGLASIVASIVLGLLTLTVTASVAYLTYQFNTKQAAVTQTSLKTAVLADFTESDDGKRTLAAIKLAAYGADAFPAIKLALGIDHDGIRAGGVQTAELMYQSRPDLQEQLLPEMLASFQERNPTLRLGVLEFYIKAASKLRLAERQTFLSRVKERLGADARACEAEDGTFVLKSATFLNEGGPFQDEKEQELLLDIARNCPHGKANSPYEGARNQAVNMLPIIVKKKHLPKTERDAIITALHELEADASSELQDNIKTAIDEIQSIQGQ